LSDADIARLEEHLASCPSCRDAMEREQTFDASVAPVMTGVDVPSSLRGQIESHLDVERGRARRRQLARAAGLVSIAAALLLAISFPLGWWAPRIAINPDQLVQEEDGYTQLLLNRNVDAAEEFFRERGLKTELPRDFDYSLLVGLDVVNFKGHDVARLEFQVGQGRAKVYVLPRKQFSLPAQGPLDGNGSLSTVEIIDGPHDYMYLVFYFGNASRQMFMFKGLVG
jgi:hypothetical protein